jgi:hypothetical protein
MRHMECSGILIPTAVAMVFLCFGKVERLR